MAGDKQYSEEFNLRIRYSEEISENKRPEPGLAMPVLGPEEKSKMEKWRITRVFLYLIITSAMCMGALIASPHHVVQVGILCIWGSAVALGKYLLSRVYRSSGSNTPPS